MVHLAPIKLHRTLNLLNIIIIVTDIEIYISFHSSKLDRSSIIHPVIEKTQIAISFPQVHFIQNSKNYNQCNLNNQKQFIFMYLLAA